MRIALIARFCLSLALLLGLEAASLSSGVVWADEPAEQPVAPKTPENPGLPVINIVEIPRSDIVDFEKEILPLLRRSCLACHNAQRSKGGLNLETPELILKGGESGPAIQTAKPEHSLLLRMSSRQEKPHMPPADNKVKATPLSGRDLGLIKLWISQGARGQVGSSLGGANWRPLAGRVKAIGALAISPDGDWAAAGRADQIHLYHIPTGRLAASLIDPQLTSAAHRDLVHSLAFSPDGKTLASGGFRAVKLWRREEGGQPRSLFAPDPQAKLLAYSADAKLAAVAGPGDQLRIFSLNEAKFGAAAALGFAPAAARFSKGDRHLLAWAADGRLALVALPELKITRSIAASGPLADALHLPGPGLIALAPVEGPIRIHPAAAPASDADKEPEKPIHTLKASQAVLCLAIGGEEGRSLLAGYSDGTIRQWQPDQAAASRQYSHGRPVSAILPASDGKQFIAIGSGEVKLFGGRSETRTLDFASDPDATRRIEWLDRRLRFMRDEITYWKKATEEARKLLADETEAAKKAQDAIGPAEADARKKDEALAKLEPDFKKAELAVEQAKQEADKAKAAAEKASGDEKKSAAKAQLDAEQALEKARTRLRTLRQPYEEARNSAMQASAVLQSARGAAALATESVAVANKAAPLAGQSLQRAEATVADLQKKIADLKVAAGGGKAGEDSRPLSVTLSVDGALSAVLFGGPAPRVNLYASPAGKLVATLPLNLPPQTLKSDPPRLALLEDGRLAIAHASLGLEIRGTQSSWALARTLGAEQGDSPFVYRITSLEFSPDGAQLAVAGGMPTRSGQLTLIDPADGRVIREFVDAHSDVIYAASFSPDGSMIATASADRQVKVFNLPDGTLHRLFERHTHHALDLAWSPSGRTLASAGADLHVRIWDVVKANQTRAVRDFKKEVSGLAWLGLSERMVAISGDGRPRIFSDTGNTQRNLEGSQAYLTAIAATPDGARVLGGDAAGRLLMWDAQSGQMTLFDAPPASNPPSPAASPGKSAVNPGK